MGSRLQNLLSATWFVQQEESLLKSIEQSNKALCVWSTYTWYEETLTIHIEVPLTQGCAVCKSLILGGHPAGSLKVIFVFLKTGRQAAKRVHMCTFAGYFVTPLQHELGIIVGGGAEVYPGLNASYASCRLP